MQNLGFTGLIESEEDFNKIEWKQEQDDNSFQQLILIQNSVGVL